METAPDFPTPTSHSHRPRLAEETREEPLDPKLIELVEAFSLRVLEGETIDPEAFLADHPDQAEILRALLPSMIGLANLGTHSPRGQRRPTSRLPAAKDEGGWPFGEYHLVREVGRGGMGVVYEARQVALDRRVALKVLSTGAAIDARAVQRFRLEAQVASWLQHPNIVPIHGVGSVDGTPFYAMRFVEGGSLAELIATLRGPSGSDAEPADPPRSELLTLAASLLADELPPSPTPTTRDDSTGTPSHPSPSGVSSFRNRAYVRSVVRLGVQAAEALAYAHDQGVVHRDIKPANLLLDRQGVLWVADFGMADVQGDAGLTATGDLPGTLRYMSPEQAAGRRALIDRRSDVYSLGATLHELLTLHPAIPGTDRVEILRRIAEAEPDSPRRQNPAVSADLATVLAKAMAKDSSGRYETARHLADDLTRVLDGRPIAARPVGPARKAWRWCRRKPLQAGLAAALALALLTGFAGVTWSWRQAVRQERLLLASEAETRRQAAAVEATNRYLVDKLLVQSEHADSPSGSRVTLMEVLDRAAAGLGTTFQGQPEVETALRLAIGRTYHGLGEHSKSEPHYRAAHALSRKGPGGPSLLKVEAATELGHNLNHLGRLAEAEPLLRSARAEALVCLEPHHAIALRSAEYLADFLGEMGRYAEAEALYREQLAAAQLASAPDPDVIYPALCNLGIAILRQGKAAEAESHYRSMLVSLRHDQGPRHPDTLATLNNLGTALLAQGKAAEAEPLLRESLSGGQATLGPRHPNTFMTTFNLGRTLERLDRWDEAEPLIRESLKLDREILGPRHPTTLRVTSTLAGMLADRGQTNEAEALLRPCLADQRQLLGTTHPETLITRQRLDDLTAHRIASGKPHP